MKKTCLWTTLSLITFLLLSSCNLVRTAPPVGSDTFPTDDPLPAQQTSIALAVQQTQTAVGPLAPESTFTPSLTSTITLTSTPEVPMVTVSQSTNCRTGPGEPYDIVGILPVGTPAEVVGKNQYGDTWIIKLPSNPSITCWLWGQWATVEGNTAGLTVYTPPPTPTPAANFTLSYLSVVDCGTFFGVRFQLTNNGSITWESYRVDIIDTTTAVTRTYSRDEFIDSSPACLPSGTLLDLTPGETGVTGSWGPTGMFTYNPAGHSLTATFKLCSQNGLAGTCVDRSVSFTP